MNDALRYSPEGERLTKVSEGLFLHAYADPKSGGEPWTIGYGHTGGIKPGDTCTQQQADDWFEQDIQKFERMVKDAVTVPLNAGQYSGLVDFIYNMGPGAPGVKDGLIWLYNGSHSSLLRKTNAGDFAGASLEFEKWDTAGPPGLWTRHRRQKELFLTGAWT